MKRPSSTRWRKWKTPWCRCTRAETQQAALRFAAEAARNAALLARYRYNGGLIDFQTVLDTERTQFTVEESLAIAKADGASPLIRLYKALGGGWSPAAATRERSEKDGGGT